MRESAHLYKGKDRKDIDFEYVNLSVAHVKDPEARAILIKKLYQYPLVMGTRDKYNISYIPDIWLKPEFKEGAKLQGIAKPRRYPKPQELQVEHHLRCYLDADVIGIATDISIFACNIIIATKSPPKNPPPNWVPEIRLCANLTQFNKCTKDIVEQIPEQTEVVKNLAGSKYLLNADVRQAFHHIRVHPSMYKWLRMIDHRGIVYYWKRAPYGVKQVPTLFNMFLMLHLPKPWISYFDDCVCGVNTLPEFEYAVEVLFQFCYKFNITLHIPKSDWFVKELVVLGYRVSLNTILPSTKSVENVLHLTKPNSKTELQALLGVINYIRKFIPNLSKYLVPMSKLLRKTAKPVFKTEKPRILNKNHVHGGNISP